MLMLLSLFSLIVVFLTTLAATCAVPTAFNNIVSYLTQKIAHLYLAGLFCSAAGACMSWSSTKGLV